MFISEKKPYGQIGQTLHLVKALQIFINFQSALRKKKFWSHFEGVSEPLQTRVNSPITTDLAES